MSQEAWSGPEPEWSKKFAHLGRTRAYIASLPKGLASYPQCRSKASIWRNILRCTDTRSLAGRLPPELETLERPTALDAAWMPSTYNFAGHLILRDCLFPSDEAICEHFRHIDRQLFSGPLYRMLFAVISPRFVVNGADRRFSGFFSGITLQAELQRDNRALLRLDFPPGVLPDLVARLYLVAFEVAVEFAGGKSVTGQMLEHGATSSQFLLAWR